MAHSPNRLLAALGENDFEALRPHLKLVDLAHGEVLAEPGGTIHRAYFPHTAIISLVVELAVGEMIETAMIGRDGALGAAAALDGKVSLNKAIVQHSGVASVLDVDRLRALTDEHKSFRSLLIRHEQVLFAEAQQSAACNASHTVEARMCRWLLRMSNLAGRDDLVLTQDFLAQMLGVRRSSVSLVAGTLQSAGLIKYRRGHIHIVSMDGLRAATCECYAAVESHYLRLCNPG